MDLSKTKLKLNELRKVVEVLVSRDNKKEKLAKLEGIEPQGLNKVATDEVLKPLSSHKRLLEEGGNGGVGAFASINTKGVGKRKKANIDVVTPEAPLGVALTGEGVPSLNEALD
ncbi:hypothetical protein L1987_28053 [Smallanthus sonchifolius]|uniref:Uncharacterized protein n=1 Tax=Smallanthus sonchifolius TaxID=185202 RepID=A0ACB9IDJ4_9ASTR|nr:hypothetical protein L1987_28053 [Smallanthus sonchifolius]